MYQDWIKRLEAEADQACDLTVAAYHRGDETGARNCDLLVGFLLAELDAVRARARQATDSVAVRRLLKGGRNAE
jgi:hypothetical protein